MLRRIFGRKSLAAVATHVGHLGTHDGVHDAVTYIEGYLAQRAQPVTEAITAVVQIGKGLIPEGMDSTAVHESQSAGWAQKILLEAGLDHPTSSVGFEEARRKLYAHYRQSYRFAAANNIYSVAVGTYPKADLNDGRRAALAEAGVLPLPWSELK